MHNCQWSGSHLCRLEHRVDVTSLRQFAGMLACLQDAPSVTYWERAVGAASLGTFMVGFLSNGLFKGNM